MNERKIIIKKKKLHLQITKVTASWGMLPENTKCLNIVRKKKLKNNALRRLHGLSLFEQDIRDMLVSRELSFYL
jgi:hypothetical protein